MSDIGYESERLLMRPFKISDATSFLRLNSDPQVMRYTGENAFQTLADYRNFLSSYYDSQPKGLGRMAVIEKSSAEMIGFCGLKHNTNGEVDLGYRLFRTAWGKGYATEASLTCMQHAKGQLKLTAIIAKVQKNNTASLKVVSKLGFSFMESRLEKDHDENLLEWQIYHLPL